MEEKLVNTRKLCLDQAQGFIEATEELDDAKFPHIVYHLCLLALEEVGKASILSAQSIRHESLADGRLDKWLDDHRKKLQWAIWSPIDRLDPKDFEDARKFAEDSHSRRLASLYVNPNAESTDPPPRERVPAEMAGNARKFARARLEIERARGTPTGQVDELTEWFLNSMEAPALAVHILSAPFRKRYEELNGDARAWAAWSREEIARLEKEAREKMVAELAKPAAAKGKAKPRWRANAAIYTPSHSLRSKPLAYWNEKFDSVKLIWTGRKDELTLQLTLNDNETLAMLPARITSLAKLVVACLNIGTTGYFWFERPGFEQKMFKDIRDLDEKKSMSIEGGESFWGDKKLVPITDELIDHAFYCMMAYMPLPDAEAEPIFRPYLDGLAFISKSDVFYNFDDLARRAFRASLSNGFRHFGGWSGNPEEFEESFHKNFESFMPEPEHRVQMLKVLTKEGDRNQSSLANLRSAKQLADLFLIHTARTRWRESFDRLKALAGA